MSVMKGDKVLTLDYLNTKLKQAQHDVELFSLLIDEVQKLLSAETKLITSNNFLKLVANRGSENTASQPPVSLLTQEDSLP
jgi:hypothetical protein